MERIQQNKIAEKVEECLNNSAFDLLKCEGNGEKQSTYEHVENIVNNIHKAIKILKIKKPKVVTCPELHMLLQLSIDFSVYVSQGNDEDYSKYLTDEYCQKTGTLSDSIDLYIDYRGINNKNNERILYCYVFDENEENNNSDWVVLFEGFDNHNRFIK